MAGSDVLLDFVGIFNKNKLIILGDGCNNCAAIIPCLKFVSQDIRKSASYIVIAVNLMLTCV